jgi:hypothetical protein
MRCLERFLTAGSLQVLLDLCIGPEPDSGEKGQAEREATSLSVTDDKPQGDLEAIEESKKRR